MTESDQGPENPETEAQLGVRERLVDEVRSHAFGYGVLAAFLVAGPLAASALFPEAPTGVGIIGGLAFGAYAAFCAVPQKFL